MFSPLRNLLIVVACLLAVASLAIRSVAQNLCTGTVSCVTMWHNDNNRTGWQPNEAILNQSNVGTSGQFGLLWQWPVTGFVFAQPLAVEFGQAVETCANPCTLIFVATEQNMLYAFNASPSAQCQTCHPLVWSLNLGTYVTCSNQPSFAPCKVGLLGPYVGVTGTPVIDTSTNTLYVVAAVQGSAIQYKLFAVNILTGLQRGTAAVIAGSVNGQMPANGVECISTNPSQGQVVNFDANHIQRSALMLIGSGTSGVVYVAFAPSGGNFGDEFENGWMFGYSFSGSSFSQPIIFNSTPNGSGGGIWQAGAAPAYDGTNIYAITGNGTFSYDVPGPPSAAVLNYGDSLLKLNPSTLSVLDYYTPPDNLSYEGSKGTGRCKNDIDFGSGGPLVPPNFTYNTQSVVINADKESNIYVANVSSLGGFNANGGNNVQLIQTPLPLRDSNQGYWASPAYWKYTDTATHYMLYYSATDQDTGVAPLPINAYSLATTGSQGQGPIPSTYLSTGTLFCYPSPTPSGSSNGAAATTGIVWAVENPNASNPHNCSGGGGPAVLHAYNATNLQELYNSSALSAPVGFVKGFPAPTIFNGQVYMGTTTGPNFTRPGVNVFGLCSSNTNNNGSCLN